MANSIFLCYRRKGGKEITKFLFDMLKRDGYSVIFDAKTLRRNFDITFLKYIDECTDVIVILNETALERCLDPNVNRWDDWFRIELAYALEKGKNIIPIFLEGFERFPENLPEDIAAIQRKCGVKFSEIYFDAFYKHLKRFLCATPQSVQFNSPNIILSPSNDANTDHKIFISYKRVDKDVVFGIKDKIEHHTGQRCWIDLDGIESDAQFANVIINAINKSQVFLFMYSHTHTQIEDYENDWTIKEINFAQKRKKRIVFINIDNAQLTDWFELVFGGKQQIDATSNEAMERLYRDLKKWLE